LNTEQEAKAPASDAPDHRRLVNVNSSRARNKQERIEKALKPAIAWRNQAREKNANLMLATSRR
jgi:hypothetical protein